MDTLREIANYHLGPFPVIFYLGILSYMFLLATGASMAIPARRKRRRPIRAHHFLAHITAILATLHALLGIVSRI